MIITIDGPAGCGKTTVAKTLAEKLGFLHIDTGALYRALTLVLMKAKVDFSNKEAIFLQLKNFEFEIQKVKGERRYFVNGQDVTEDIRLPEVTKRVSEVAAMKEARDHFLGMIRELSSSGNAVFEGRDMGTVVFPNADLKIYLNARAAVRAERRYLELKEKGIAEVSVLNDIINRDQLDSTREHAPLKKAEGAHEIDTSDLSIEEVVAKIMSMVKR